MLDTKQLMKKAIKDFSMEVIKRIEDRIYEEIPPESIGKKRALIIIDEVKQEVKNF